MNYSMKGMGFDDHALPGGHVSDMFGAGTTTPESAPPAVPSSSTATPKTVPAGTANPYSDSGFTQAATQPSGIPPGSDTLEPLEGATGIKGTFQGFGNITGGVSPTRPEALHTGASGLYKDIPYNAGNPYQERDIETGFGIKQIAKDKFTTPGHEDAPVSTRQAAFDVVTPVNYDASITMMEGPDIHVGLTTTEPYKGEGAFTKFRSTQPDVFGSSDVAAKLGEYGSKSDVAAYQAKTGQDPNAALAAAKPPLSPTTKTLPPTEATPVPTNSLAPKKGPTKVKRLK